MDQQSFDFEVGMAVYDTQGQQIGNVVEVAGFGSSRIPGVSGTANERPVTQSRGGTGYLKISRRDPLGHEAKDLVVPERGVILTAYDAPVSLRPVDMPGGLASTPAQCKGSKWPLHRLRRKS